VLSSRRCGPVLAAVLAALLMVTLAPAAASARDSGGLPPPRVASLRPRIATLSPRIISVAPRQPRPSTFVAGSDVLFAFGSSQLSVNAQAVLASVVAWLDKRKAGTVLVTGYTDSIGTISYNLGLSLRRAESVLAYLRAHVTSTGLTYQAKGLGEADPVAPNTLPNGQDNPAGRQKNRRVVIVYRQ
jgi:outer membrane protein OmpA-like peptidoglycan-associated protein